MATLADLQKRFRKVRTADVRVTGDEVLVADSRARMGPGHFVEEKLRMVMPSNRRGLPTPK